MAAAPQGAAGFRALSRHERFDSKYKRPAPRLAHVRRFPDLLGPFRSKHPLDRPIPRPEHDLEGRTRVLQAFQDELVSPRAPLVDPECAFPEINVPRRKFRLTKADGSETGWVEPDTKVDLARGLNADLDCHAVLVDARQCGHLGRVELQVRSIEDVTRR